MSGVEEVGDTARQAVVRQPSAHFIPCGRAERRCGQQDDRGAGSSRGRHLDSRQVRPYRLHDVHRRASPALEEPYGKRTRFGWDKPRRRRRSRGLFATGRLKVAHTTASRRTCSRLFESTAVWALLRSRNVPLVGAFGRIRRARRVVQAAGFRAWEEPSVAGRPSMPAQYRGLNGSLGSAPVPPPGAATT